MSDRCETCNDTARVPCPQCDGAGEVPTTMPDYDYSAMCLRCNGTGKVRCPECRCDCGDNWTDGKNHRDCHKIP